MSLRGRAMERREEMVQQALGLVCVSQEDSDITFMTNEHCLKWISQKILS